MPGRNVSRQRGIGSVAKEAILAGKSNQEALAIVKRNFPKSKTKLAGIRYNRNELRKKHNSDPDKHQYVKTETELKKERGLIGKNKIKKSISSKMIGKRTAKIVRNTSETKVEIKVELSGNGNFDIKTGIGFFDHMLEQLSRHSMMDLTVRANGDLLVDNHHTVEDVGIVLGQCVKQALDDKSGITRFAEMHVAMDESLTRCVIDISGRHYLVWKVDFHTPKIGEFDTELVREFFQAFSMNAGITLHLANLYGTNSHHIAESCFKAVAICLRKAVELDPLRADKIPSTKGKLGG